MYVPTGSAVLLLHNGHGAFPIASGDGLSSSAAHALDYDGRQGAYDEKGGCDREPTERDRALASARTVSEDAARHLDYAARTGAWAAGADRMPEDCSYWGQNGPLYRAEIERDMLACGGCYLKSVVSVDRRYAGELGLDSKAAFEKLLRANWQDIMVAAGVADRAPDVHWYACYHTDAENSLHVHVATWAADGRIEQGWHPSARATREQKAMLYRDAYEPLRMQRNLERDYYWMLLPKLAAAEMGARIPEGVERRLRAKAERAGVREIPLRCSLDERGRAAVANRAQTVAARLDEGRGLKARDWKLQSDAGKVLQSIRRHSAAFDEALSRYRQIAESKADLAGFAVAGKAHDAVLGPRTKADQERADAAREVARHERERFVRREMDDVMRRIRNEVIRTADPSERVRGLARAEIDRVRHGLFTKSLNPEAIGLSREDAARLREIYAAAARDGGTTREFADEAARIVSASELARRVALETAGRVAATSGGTITHGDALDAVNGQIGPQLADAARWRLSEGQMTPGRVEAPSGAAPDGQAQGDRHAQSSISAAAHDESRDHVGEASMTPVDAIAAIAAAIVRERGEGGESGSQNQKGVKRLITEELEERAR